MEKSAILTADILDIIFEGRNKEYGAYELRRTYNKRLRISVLVMLAVMVLLFLGQLFAGKNDKGGIVEFGSQIELQPPPPDEATPPPPPPPPMKTPPPVKTVMLTTPVITDEEIKPKEQMAEIDDMEDAKIGTKNQDGEAFTDVVAPPVETAVSTGVIEAPKKEKDSLFLKVEIDAQYPGGTAKWQRFLQRNLDGKIPQVAIDNGIQGTIMIQFIVDKEGNVSNVQAISGPEELRELGVSVIKKSGKWIPAIQNGQKVKAYKMQPITIQVVSDN